MSDKKSKVICACTLAVVILAVMAIPTLFPFRSSKTLSISFVCLTNSQYFGPVAAFCGSNTCDHGLSILFYSPQSKIHGAWSQPTEQFLDIDADLGPHQSVQFVVPIVTNQTPWRVIAKWHYEKKESQIKKLWIWGENLVPLSWQRFFNITRPSLLEYSTGPVYESYSPEMTNK